MKFIQKMELVVLLNVLKKDIPAGTVSNIERITGLKF